jgi:hypothetical protein
MLDLYFNVQQAILSLVSTSLFLPAAAAETQLPLPLFFDPYIIIMTVSTSLPNQPAAAA